MTKLNLIKSDPDYYRASKKPVQLNLKPLPYLTISGVSAPEDALFSDSISTIYPLAFAIKFLCKSSGQDFVMPKMEAFWWVESELPFNEVPRKQWHWKILIRMPDFVTTKIASQARKELKEKKDLPLLEQVTFETIYEKTVVQALHLGSYEAEGPTLEKIYHYIEDNGLEINGYHREIYLTDPRRTSEERLRTLLRYAVMPKKT